MPVIHLCIMVCHAVRLPHLDRKMGIMRDKLYGCLAPVAFISVVIALVIGLSVGVIALAQQGDKATCESMSISTGYDTKFEGTNMFTAQCYVLLPDEGWVPADRWRGGQE